MIDPIRRTILISYLIGTISETIIQAIYTSRIWIRESHQLRVLSSDIRRRNLVSDKRRVITGTLTLLVFAQLVTSIIYFAQNADVFATLEMNNAMVQAIKAMNAIATFVDFSLAAAFVYFLRKQHFKGISKSIRSVLTRLVLFAVGSGLLTGLCGLVGLFGAIIQPSSYLYLLAGLIMPKCKPSSLSNTGVFHESLGYSVLQLPSCFVSLLDGFLSLTMADTLTIA